MQKKVDEAERTVRRNVTGRNLIQQQFDALVSFTYDSPTKGARHVLREVNAGHFARAASLIGHSIHVTVRDRHGHPRLDVHGHKIKVIQMG